MRSLIWVSMSLLAIAGPANGAELSQLLGGAPFQTGDPFNGGLYLAGSSADERFLLLRTDANNLARGIVDFNQDDDYYVFDRSTGSYDLVSRSAEHPERAAVVPKDTVGMRPPPVGFVSDDGRWVAFGSAARDMIAGAFYPAQWTNDHQVFLFDRASRSIRLVSHAWNSATVASSEGARLFAMSSDGRFVAFESLGANLTAAGLRATEVYVFDRESGENRLITHQVGQPGSPALGKSSGRAMTPDGRFVSLTSWAMNLVPGQVDSPFTNDAFLYDCKTGTMELLSRAAGTGSTAAGGDAAQLSSDGRFVTLTSYGVALGAGLEDGNGGDVHQSDCFLLDRQAGSVRLVSRSAVNPLRSGDRRSLCGELSHSGSRVFFTSSATDLVAGFGGTFAFASANAYVFDAGSGQVSLASHAAGSASESGDGSSAWAGSMPAALEGSYRILSSEASNLQVGVVDTPFLSDSDFFLYDLLKGESTLVSRLGSSLVAGGQVSGSALSTADGAILFGAHSPRDPAFPLARHTQLYRFDLAQEDVRLELGTPLSGVSTDGLGTFAMLDRGGRYFGRRGRALDSVTGESLPIVHAAGQPSVPANRDGELGGASADGRYFSYTTGSTDVAPIADDNDNSDVYVYDRAAGAPRLVSHSVGRPAVASLFGSQHLWTSADGTRLFFHSSSPDVSPGYEGPIQSNLYFYDLEAGVAELVSHRHDEPRAGTVGLGRLAAATPDALRLVYASQSGDLVPGFADNNDNNSNLFFYDRGTRQAALVDRRPGTGNDGSSKRAEQVKMTADGSSVFFDSQADDLVPGQVAQPVTYKVFRWNRATGENELVVHESGKPAEPCKGSVYLADISPDGRWVLLWGSCSLVAGDSNTTNDVYLVDRIAGATFLVSHQPGAPGVSLGVDSRAGDLSDDARQVAYTAVGAPFAWDRAAGSRRPLLTAFYDPEEPVGAAIEGASADGSRILLRHDESKAVQFDADEIPDSLLVTLGLLFADGFESGDTAAWSQAIP
jgi:TolB protein